METPSLPPWGEDATHPGLGDEFRRYKVAIIGGGFVGKATSLFYSPRIEKMMIWDMNPERRWPRDLKYEDLADVDVVFICVWTPPLPNGQCDTSYVEKAISDFRQLSSLGGAPPIVVRSTVPPGFCDAHDVYFMPEFLTEKNWKEDFINTKTWCVGTPNFRNADWVRRGWAIFEIIDKIISSAAIFHRIKSRDVIYASTIELELAKYARNCFLAVKVAYFNEIASLATQLGLDYATLRPLITADPRIGDSHTQVPGPDGKYGFGGTCLPKDIAALNHEFEKNEIDDPILKAAIARNSKDRC